MIIDYILDQITSNGIWEVIGHFIALFALAQIYVIMFIRRKEVLDDLRGKDLVWQFLELSGIVWLVLFPAMVVIAIFGVDIPVGVWSTMDIVYFINVLGKRADKLIEARFGIATDHKVTEEEVTLKSKKVESVTDSSDGKTN